MFRTHPVCNSKLQLEAITYLKDHVTGWIDSADDG